MKIWLYMAEMGGSLAAYGLILVVSIHLLDDGGGGRAWRTAISLSPMLPAGLACWSLVRHLRRMDELQRKLQVEALGLAFAGTALLTFAYGFLENVGYPKLSMFAVWPVMAGLWALGTLVAHLRYR